MEKDPAAFKYEEHALCNGEGNIRDCSLDHHLGHGHEQNTTNVRRASYHDPPSRVSHHSLHHRVSTPVPPAAASEPLQHFSTETWNDRRKDMSFTLTPEMFEKLYLNPPNTTQSKNDLTSKFGNPTPIALLGFLLTASPLSCMLMGWMGAGGGGAAITGSFYFIGGFLMSLGGILEFFLGNTFSFVVFCSFGGFWFTFGATLTPAFNAYGAYSPDPANPALGLESAQFHASFGFFLLFAGLLTLMYTICALRTNVIFVGSFTMLTMLFAVLTGSYWNTAIGSHDLAKQQQFVAGGFGLASVSGGWYLFFAQMLASVDFPLVLPVGDLSQLIKPLSARIKEKEAYSA